MNGADGGLGRISISPIETGHQPCWRHRQRKADRWATWRVDVTVSSISSGKPWGTTSYVCGACLGPFVRAYMVRYVVVEPTSPTSPARAARANGARPRKKAVTR